MRKALLILAAALLLGACSRKVYVPVETVRTDTLRVLSQHTDTIIDRDSVFTIVSGDTVTREIVRWRLRYRDRVDTVYRARTDTIARPYEVERRVEVDRPLRWWQKALMWAGAAAAALLAIVGVRRLRRLRIFPLN